MYATRPAPFAGDGKMSVVTSFGKKFPRLLKRRAAQSGSRPSPPCYHSRMPFQDSDNPSLISSWKRTSLAGRNSPWKSRRTALKV